MSEQPFDIASNIRMTQELQCQMLSLLSDFFTAMQHHASKTEQTERLADMEIALRLMAARLGISGETLSHKAVMRMKAHLVQSDTPAWESDLLSVLHTLDKA